MTLEDAVNKTLKERGEEPLSLTVSKKTRKTRRVSSGFEIAPADVDSPDRIHVFGEMTVYTQPKTEAQVQTALTNQKFQRGVAWRSSVIMGIVAARRRKWSDRKIYAYLTVLGLTPERIQSFYQAADVVEEYQDAPE